LWFQIAVAYSKLKRAGYAKECLKKSLQLNPNYPEALELIEKISYEAFSKSGLFDLIDNPIKGVIVEGSNVMDKCIRALKVYSPYLSLKDSGIKIVDIKGKTISVAITGKLGETVMPSPIVADVQSFLHDVDPTLIFVYVNYLPPASF